MFSVDSKIKIWRVDRKDKYTSCQISSSVKDKETNEYVVDFNGFVNFVGKAHSKNPQVGDIVKIKECGVTTYYDKANRKQYTNCTVFDYEQLDKSHNPQSIENMAIVSEDDDLPF